MNSFRKSSIVFSAFLLAYFGEIAINIACGPEPDPYDYYVSYFHNNTAGEGYTPFSLNHLQVLYSETEPESEADINSADWADYLGGGVEPADVKAVMYLTDAATDTVIAAYLNRDIKELPDSLSGNTYLKALKTHKGARNYYLFAKTVEPHATTTYSYWDPEPVDDSAMVALGEAALKLTKKTKRDKFLQYRYAYQAARMYHFCGGYDQAVAIYDEWLANPHQPTAVSGWALSLKAGAERRLGEAAEAAYLFSRVFQLSPERRVQAYKNFNYIDVAVEEVLAFTQSDEEKAAILAIEGFHNTDFDPETLSSVYQLAPASPLVGALLTREINKLEHQLTEASMYYNGGWWSDYYRPDSVQEKARTHAAWVAAFAHRLATEKRYSEPELGTVSEAYIQWLLKNNEQAGELLVQLNPDRLSERLADQYRIVELLVHVRQLTAGDAVDEKALLPALQWLDRKRAAEVESIRKQYGREYYYWRDGKDMRFNRTAANLYQSVLVPHYMAQQDTAMAALLMRHGESFAAEQSDASTNLFDRMGWSTQAFWQEQLQPAALEQLAEWGRNGVDRPWAALFEGELGPLDSDEFWDLLGTAYLRVHDYPAASKAFANLSDEFEIPQYMNWYNGEDETIHPDPFITTINDYPKQFGTESLTKAGFAQTMAGLQQKIETDPANAAEYYFQLANGVYQTGAFGNAWQLISYNWTSADNYVKGNYYYSGDYHEARQAAAWYEKARRLSNDPEFRARCTFMLAKCEQKQYQFESISEYYDQYDSDYYAGNKPDPFWLFSQHNPYFDELAKEYSDTEFVKRAVYECSYLSDFIY